MKLFVAKLNRDAVESDLLEWFGAMGPVRSAKVVTDRDTGQSKCFGFVEMETREGGEKAIAEMNGQEFMNFRMVVKEAEERGARPKSPHPGSSNRNSGSSPYKSSSSDARSPAGGGDRSPGNPSFGADKKSTKKKKSQRLKPDKYSDGPRQTKMRKPKGGGGSQDWGDYDEDF